MQHQISALPANPYTRQPVKKKDSLAGRRRELDEVRYYLNLTTAGQSYHLALIGARGSGKTSLLNAADFTARELKLLPVRIDLNENKARTPGDFWHDVYATLLLDLQRANCWNGHPALFNSLFQMIHGRKSPTDLDMVVLRMPFVIASHPGPWAEMHCPDALIVDDFNVIIDELKRRLSMGLVLLIDEGDCLGQNRPLIQMFRNIFQRVDGCSLVLAGTEAVFPALSDVFSPIPRQFHRISVQAFSHWGQTRDLIFKPFDQIGYDAFKHVLPSIDTVQELHELCGGAPDELQLYCHHMYKQVESRSPHDGPHSMALTPQVFREVLNEYRSSSPYDIEPILDKVETLPEKLLYRSPWLRRRRLSLENNIRCAIFAEELKQASPLLVEHQQAITKEIHDGYLFLQNAGITQDADRLELVGRPLTDGFWKSFVEVEKKRRWTWSDETFDDVMVRLCSSSIVEASDGVFARELGDVEQSADSLAMLRAGHRVDSVDQKWFTDLELITSISREKNLKDVVEVSICIDFAGRRRAFKTWNAGNVEMVGAGIQQWLVEHQPIIDRYGMSAQLQNVRLLQLPTNDEIHRLAYIGQLPVFESFGPSLIARAVEAYKDGNVDETIAVFQAMLADADSVHIRNNLAYCLALQRRYDEAAVIYEHGTLREHDINWPLWQHNRGVVACLKGDIEAGTNHLQDAVTWIEGRSATFDARDVVCMMLLEPGLGAVRSRDGLPIDAAALLNLYIIGRLSYEDVRSRLAELYPDEHKVWLPWVPDGNSTGPNAGVKAS